MYMTEAELAEQGVSAATPLRIRAAETTIEAYTGQRFTQWIEDVSVTVDENGEARLPHRILDIEIVTEEDGTIVSPLDYTFTSSSTRGQGDVLRVQTIPLSGATFDLLTKGLEPWSTTSRVYTRSRRLTVSAEWGWDAVPEDVQTALVALLSKPVSATENLTNVKALSMKSMSVTFKDSGLDDTTGDAFVDRLLTPYRVLKSATSVEAV